ncbi:MAG: PorV/PorQ family protein [candidate division Zixibacteria bacterium]|nr:PorV/PorQ family protein [candidate division Zixibacteria bacterium]
MNLRRQLLTATMLIVGLGLAGEAMADISNAAVLFLRIAPGSRAAGMGEAFVAIADDATATHWNPAGLGSYPLSDAWIETGIQYQPLKAFAPLSTGGERSHLDYDIWAITEQGLVRYDNKKWQIEEVFGTRTDESVEQKVKTYFQVADDTLLAGIVDRVATANNLGTYDELVVLRDKVVSALPSSYDRVDVVSRDLDSLLVAFRLCLVNWERVKEIRERLSDGMKDSTLSNTECDRIAAALEHSRNRYLPEELRIPYNALFNAKPTSIASSRQTLLVGSSDGLARFNGKNWAFVTRDDNQPLAGVTSLNEVGGTILVVTNTGIEVFRGLTLSPLTRDSAGLPPGPVEAIGGNALTELYAVVNNGLYRFNGLVWTNATNYTVAIDDSLDKIAVRYSIYGTAADRERFIEKYKSIQAALPVQQLAPPAPAAMDTTARTVAGTDTTTATEVDTTTTVKVDTTMAAVIATVGIPGVDSPLTPGAQIFVPLAASVKGHVRSIFVDNAQRIWLGTDIGVIYFDGQRWNTPGYAEHAMTPGETLDSLVAKRSNLSDEQRTAYRALLTEINDLDSEAPAEGAVVRVHSNPAAQPVNEISGDGRTVYVATQAGLIEFDGRNWSRTGLSSMTEDNIVGLKLLGEESWIASDSRLVIKGKGHSEISLMHVNWLPELASDLYYECLAATSNRDWGTIGGSITFISYGKFRRTSETGVDEGEFVSYDVAAAASYGTSLTSKLKGGISAKLIYSQLSVQGAGAETTQNKRGTSTGIAVDLGLLYHMTPRLTLGSALTNLGPKMSYFDSEQADDLPRNLAIGFAYRLLRSDYASFIVTVEANKLLVGLNRSFGAELKESIINSGVEFTYADLLSARAGYIYDQEGEIKTPTVGFGLSPFTWGKFDFAYIPSQKDFSLANTLRISLRIVL